jgi:hypothetical protein
MKSPFKFLDSYTKDDREIFFGREREIEELYHRVFESKIMLVYGVSGTGKSSLIHCGLANKFQDTDWLPLVIRRGANIIDSMAAAIKGASITEQQTKLISPGDFKKGVRSLYLDQYKPVFFIFDQFEELFIFGDKEERKSFVQIVKSLYESELQCRMIFVMREEYMAGVTEFEKYISSFFANRVRIEKMLHINALEAIKGPCKVVNISLEEGFAEALLEKLNPDETDVELTYLQVFLDKIFRLASGSTFALSLLSLIGNVSDLLGSFLEEQLKVLDEPDTGLAILKSFVSIKGTKRLLTQEEVIESSKAFKKDIPAGVITDYLQMFVNIRILRDKDDKGKYELRHDSLATKIYEKITLVEKELLEIYQFLDNAYATYKKRNVLLSANDLAYIAPYEDRLFTNKEIENLIDKSKTEFNKGKKRIKRIAIGGFVAIVIYSIGALMMAYRLPLYRIPILLGVVVYLFWFLPLFGYYIFKSKENRTINLLFLIFTLLFASNIFVYNTSVKSKMKYQLSKPLIQNDQKLYRTIERYGMIADTNYSKIDNAYSENSDLNIGYRISALDVKEKTEELFDFIQGLKIIIVSTTEAKREKSPAIIGREIDFEKLDRLDENNIPSEIMIGANQNGKAFDLKALLNDYKSSLKELINGDLFITKIIDNALNLDDQKEITSEGRTLIYPWENITFQSISLGFTLITLTQIQQDIKYLESEVTSFLYNKVKTELEKKSGNNRQELAVISLLNMNVLYLNVENPLDIAIPGISDEQLLNVKYSNGNAVIKNGYYYVRPTMLGECYIEVSYKDDKGKIRFFPPKKFKIKDKPLPVASIKGIIEDKIKKAEPLGSKELIVSYPSDFDFGVTFKVTGFTIATNRDGQMITADSNNNLFTDEQRQLFTTMRKGDKLYIQDIHVEGSDGSILSLKGLIYTID